MIVRQGVIVSGTMYYLVDELICTNWNVSAVSLGKLNSRSFELRVFTRERGSRVELAAAVSPGGRGGASTRTAWGGGGGGIEGASRGRNRIISYDTSVRSFRT